ncbi:hypothetical protein ATANTOWER_018506 [Ataeniobius toweri]|uniref:Uncharacterized protein n=1 Tax=Ataeniobius toweri TaxID=208326 RepID=A0ABU7APY1_9TELE|nr:hypothetical protein [Ataeniobius toweri]
MGKNKRNWKKEKWFLCVIICMCLMQVKLQNAQSLLKEEKKSEKQGCDNSGESLGMSGECFDDKAIYFHRLSVPDLPQVLGSHIIDPATLCEFMCVLLHVCIYPFLPP